MITMVQIDFTNGLDDKEGANLGYYRVNNHPQWSDIKSGSLVVLVSDDRELGVNLDPYDSNADDVFILNYSNSSPPG